jgi:hypothetical protein
VDTGRAIRAWRGVRFDGDVLASRRLAQHLKSRA